MPATESDSVTNIVRSSIEPDGTDHSGQTLQRADLLGHSSVLFMASLYNR